MVKLVAIGTSLAELKRHLQGIKIRVLCIMVVAF